MGLTLPPADEPGAARGRDGPPPSRTGLVAVVTGLAVLAVLLAAVAGRLPSSPTGGLRDQLELLPLLVLAAFLGLEFRAGREGDRVDLFDPAVAAALVTLPGPRLLALVLVAKACALTVQRVPRRKTAFNLSQWGCAAAAGSAVYAWLRSPAPGAPVDLLALALALVVAAALNAAAVQLVLAVVAGWPEPGARARGLLKGVALGTVVNLALGLLAAVLWRQVPASRPAIPLALVAVHLAARLWAQQQAGTRRLVGLERANAALAGPGDLAVALPHFLSEVRQAFECAGVELHLRLDPGAPLRRIAEGRDAGGSSGPLVATLMHRAVAMRLAPADVEPDLLALLTDAGWHDCLAVPVRRHGQVVGLLCTHDREGWEGFESAELAVLEAAAGVLGEALHRQEMAAVLRAERAALRGSEVRWRALAHVLQLVARGAPLPGTLTLLARTLEEQTGSGRCVLLVRVPGEHLATVAPGVPAPVTKALGAALLPQLHAGTDWDGTWLPPLDEVVAAVAGPVGLRALQEAGLGRARAWSLPCSADSGATGVLLLCYPSQPEPDEHAEIVDGAVRVAALAVEHVLAQRRLAHQAGHDPLTDLPNRAVFLDRLGHALRSTGRSGTYVVVLFLDLDRFKVVNDSLGHGAGDALLCAIAGRLRSAVRPGDTVARFGGDEFTILCEGIHDEAHALRVVQRVQDVLRPPFPLGDVETFATASIGMALGRGAECAPETLVEDADAAMYRAKENGGGTLELFDDAMRDRAVGRLRTHSALHRALERSEFHVVYQPIVRLATGRLDGVEALVRWDRPGHGVVHPGHFVPLAEETGLIVPIGACVLREACRQAGEWTATGQAPEGFTVSVNLSGRQLTDPGLVPLVQEALDRGGTDPSTISLEITETVLMSDVSAVGAVLSGLKALGVRLYVDDFGTGYSSLTYLQRFPVDGVKVDQSFVAGLGERPDDAAIVRAVIGLAHGLGLVAVAEGVETRDQLSRLVDLECDVAQGYYLGRPMPAEAVPVGRGRG